MFKRYILIFLLLISFILVPLNAFGKQFLGHRNKVIQLKDMEFGGYIDVNNLSLTDNSTHLLINIDYDGALPVDNPSIEFTHWLQIDLDLDNDFQSGRKDYFSYARDIILFFVFSSTLKYGLLINDQWDFYDIPNEWFNFTSSSFSAAIPFNELPTYLSYIVSVNSNFRILRIMVSTGIEDYFIDKNFRSNIDLMAIRKDISVDGDPSDWNGVPPTMIDSGDIINHQYQDLNVTALYSALSTDGQVIYHLVNLSSVFNETSYLNFPNYTVWYDTFQVFITYDVDNDGVDDLTALYTPRWAIITNLSNGMVFMGYPSTMEYNISQAGKWIEISLNSSVPGIYEIPSGNIKLGANVSWNFRDYVPSSRDIIPYTIGGGGYVSHFIEPTNTNILAPWYGYHVITSLNPSLLYLDDFSIKLNVSDETSLLLRQYDNELSGVTSVDAASNFFVLWFYDINTVEWPLQINITYNENNLKNMGVKESELVPLHFNNEKGIYEAFKDYTVDRHSNIVHINVSKNEYVVSDGIIVLGRVHKPKEEKYVFSGLSTNGISQLSLDLSKETGKLIVTNLLLNKIETYEIRFTVKQVTPNSLLLEGYIRIKILDKELYLPVTIFIDKLMNRAYVIGPISFISVSG